MSWKVMGFLLCNTIRASLSLVLQEDNVVWSKRQCLKSNPSEKGHWYKLHPTMKHFRELENTISLKDIWLGMLCIMIFPIEKDVTWHQ